MSKNIVIEKSNKGKLVKKFCEHVERNEYINVKGKDQKGIGIYVLYNENGLYYIGLSISSLRRRLKKHAKGKHKNEWNNFSYYQIPKSIYVKDIETLLLRIARPNGNKVLGKFPNKNNLAVKIRENERKIRVIKNGRKS